MQSASTPMKQPRCLHPRVKERLGGVRGGFEGRRSFFWPNSRKAADLGIENGKGEQGAKVTGEAYDHHEAAPSFFRAASKFRGHGAHIFLPWKTQSKKVKKNVVLGTRKVDQEDRHDEPEKR